MQAFSGVANHGILVGANQRNQPILGQRTGPGEWSATNPVTGASFEATRTGNLPGPTSHWDVTRTGPLGYQQHNDFTVVRRPDGQVQAFDLNRSGFQPLSEKESFDATIKGDPHFSVSGSIDGQDVNASFDNQDLGTRTQYQGAGFKLDTNTVPCGNGGAAVVDQATVTTGFGRRADEVTVNADGSMTVNGEAVSLEDGQSMQLNRTSSVSYQDGAYTVSSRNGKVTNTISNHASENGNYLNIEASVDDVQTVGWMQEQVG